MDTASLERELWVHNRRVLKVHATSVNMEPMVHTEGRDEFSSRLLKALKHAGHDGYGMGARLARQLKVTPKAASKWLNGETRPGHGKKMELANWLGVREEWLDYGRGPMLPRTGGHASSYENAADKPEASGVAEQARTLSRFASERSASALRHIEEAAIAGYLTEDDLVLLEQIAKRIATRPQSDKTNLPNAPNQRLKKDLGIDDPSSDK